MPFPGDKTPGRVQSIIAKNLADWPRERAYVACSGNFAPERLLRNHGFAEVHGNDTGLYSAAVGAYLAGDPLPFTLEPDIAERFHWLADSLDTPERALATLLISTQIAPFIRKTHPYYVRMFRAYEQQWPVLLARTVERVQALDLPLATFTLADPVEWVAGLDKDAPVLVYPPQLKGRAASQARALERMFVWDRPTVPAMTEERQHELFDRIADRQHWLFYAPQRLPAYQAYCRAKIKPTNRAAPVYVYGSGPRVAIIRPWQMTAPILAPRLGPTEDIGERVSLWHMTYPEFCTLRSQYMNHGIRPGAPALMVGVLVDGKVIGSFAVSTPTESSKYANYHGAIPPPWTYLMSDFPVAPSKYKHLAKLINYMVLSKEAQLLIQQLMKRRIRSITTSACSNKPVSMKYRGLYTLLKREPLKDIISRNPYKDDMDLESEYYSRKWEMEYGALLGQWTAQQGFEEWKRRYGSALKSVGEKDEE